jgi:hypothetical protein
MDDRREVRTLQDLVDGLTQMDLRHIALVAFVVGILFHVCVVYAVLDDGESASTPATETPLIRQATPLPTRPPDRSDCAEIRGTDYRSDAERAWFQANCSGAVGPDFSSSPGG